MKLALRCFCKILLYLLVGELCWQKWSTKDRQITRTHVHATIPLAVGHLLVVVSCQFAYLLISLLTLCYGSVQMLLTFKHIILCATVGILACSLCLKNLCGVGCGCQNRIFDSCEISIFQFRTYVLLLLLYHLAYSLIALKIAVELVAKLTCRELGVAYLTQAAVVNDFAHLNLAPSHKLRTALATEAVELVHHWEQFFSHFLAKLTTKPCLVVVVDGLSLHAVDVPCHIEEQFEVVASHLGVMHVYYPYLAHVMVVGSLHLIVYQTRLCGCQPKVVVWATPVAQVVIYTATANTLLFVFVREACHIAIVIVTPHQSNIVGHLQSALVYFKHLFVWHKHLCLL